MAKKMSTGKVVALALCVIVGAGSIAAFARGRDKDDEKDKGTGTHVCSFEESNVCSCGERQETILLSEVKVGMDLSGYTIRYSVNWEEFSSHLSDGSLKTKDGETVPQVTIVTTSHTMSFEDCYVFDDGKGGAFLEWENESSFDSGCDIVFPEGEKITAIPEMAAFEEYPMELFEFYYVGLPESNSMKYERQTRMRNNSVVDTSFEDVPFLIVDGIKDDNTWTPIY